MAKDSAARFTIVARNNAWSRVALRSTLGFLGVRLSRDRDGIEKQMRVAQREWAQRLAAWASTGVLTEDELQRMQRCPPPGGDVRGVGFRALSCRASLLCPFCWGRGVARAWRELDALLFPPDAEGKRPARSIFAVTVRTVDIDVPARVVYPAANIDGDGFEAIVRLRTGRVSHPASGLISRDRESRTFRGVAAYESLVLWPGEDAKRHGQVRQVMLHRERDEYARNIGWRPMTMWRRHVGRGEFINVMGAFDPYPAALATADGDSLRAYRAAISSARLHARRGALRRPRGDRQE